MSYETSVNKANKRGQKCDFDTSSAEPARRLLPRPSAIAGDFLLPVNLVYAYSYVQSANLFNTYS